MNSTLTNIEKLDITGLTLNTANNNTEFNFTEAMIDAWTGSSTGNLTLSLKSSQVEKIMLEENTQCVASALRNSIINFGKIPKICYQDNGRALKNKFFK